MLIWLFLRLCNGCSPPTHTPSPSTNVMTVFYCYIDPPGGGVEGLSAQNASAPLRNSKPPPPPVPLTGKNASYATTHCGFEERDQWATENSDV